MSISMLTSTSLAVDVDVDVDIRVDVNVDINFDVTVDVDVGWHQVLLIGTDFLRRGRQSALQLRVDSGVGRGERVAGIETLQPRYPPPARTPG